MSDRDIDHVANTAALDLRHFGLLASGGVCEVQGRARGGLMRRHCPPRRPLAERLWEKIRGPSADPSIGDADCWLWTGGWRPRFGYGRIREAGRGSRCLQAHVLVYEIVRGPIPAGQWLRHSCDRPLCCNPWHLEPGTAAENYADQVLRGRRPAAARAA